MTKAALRENILKKRNALSNEEIVKRSQEIFRKVGQLECFHKAEVVMAYMNFGSEVRTEDFIRMCIKTGRRVLIPLIVKKAGERYLVPCEINDPEKDVDVGTYGIREPRCGAKPFEDYGSIDLIIVPGLVFGRDMYRIGYGKGYYDRFLTAMGQTKCLKIGVCFCLQLVETIPAQAHDVPLDIIVTEEEVIRKAYSINAKTTDGGSR